MTTTAPEQRRRGAGVLLHPTSLPGTHHIGDLGAEARGFVNWLEAAGMSTWQVLPLGPSHIDCPYVAWSALAGNPLLVDLLELREVGLLDDALAPAPPTSRVEFLAAKSFKLPRLAHAAERLLHSPRHPWAQDFQRFHAEANWARDAAIFDALKEQHGGASWREWEPALVGREPAALGLATGALRDGIDRRIAEFYFFERQWRALKSYANDRGVRILGDLPIYVDGDSADVWTHRDLFELDEAGRPSHVSGVPPDYFSEKGQLWGNPLYRWERMATDEFAWWRARLARALVHCDVVRIDHFRAFSAFWAVPAGSADARSGAWRPGPGIAFFEALTRAWGKLPLVAEDLGLIDEPVHELRRAAGLPGMRVLQFAFDGDPNNPHLPQNHPTDCVAYPGTHDNDTVAGWWAALDEPTKGIAARELGLEINAGTSATHTHRPSDEVPFAMVRATFGSRAELAVAALQDLLALGTDARMNNPATPDGNWSYRLKDASCLSPALAHQLAALVVATSRAT
ncbi:MAG: 4-alpha-glucanotransferase [Myxococcales bacterium]|nr:4-alpha-glucanotransferase [Myxococcales bacterium]